ncbi:hypothetical protein HOR33_gp08 [Klebsiella phage vB_KpnP_IL33]|uniref:Fusion protein n=1 Tax=Klebsiella phage vB_KpnP_IL33 TaxID=1907783 RepID=A0A1V0E6B7_9CAUD|nr:hypothetical protein HOR33_gp08 [Klebsiella phage vB_KpnP_IL33]ARB12417.1 hypothetical protein IL33_08 [Klebsiella phage vB_KpnP_IL33]
MTYSIVVTILLIIVTALFISAIRDSLRSEERLQRTVREANSAFNSESCKVLRLADKADSLSRQVRYLEGELEGEKQKVRDVNELRAHQRDRMKFLRKQLKEAQNELLMVSDLIHIKFTALLPDGQPVKTLFKLGLGPCGLHVKSLRWTELEDRYLIDQLCTNGERKQFVYYKNEVVGRIEFRHGKA